MNRLVSVPTALLKAKLISAVAPFIFVQASKVLLGRVDDSLVPMHSQT